MGYVIITAFALLISSIFFIGGINTIKRRNAIYDGVTTGIVENIEVTQRNQNPRTSALFITYRYTVNGVEYHSRENIRNKNNANVGLHDNADELGVKLGIPINSEIEVKYQLKKPSRSVYDVEWMRYTASLGGVMGVVLGGVLTAVLLIVEALLIWGLFV